MRKNFMAIPRGTLEVDTGASQGKLEAWRHTLGQGGVNGVPYPERVISGLQKLRPLLVRVFLQEYFDVYPDHGIFHWEKLDAYLESIAATGAKVLATINFKPRPLYPTINQDIWRPSDIEEWQELIRQLVRRYSLEKPVVTYWESANEPDIGENGGCPFRLGSVEEIHEFYRLTMKPVLDVFPQAKIGGPCPADSGLTIPFIDLCMHSGTRLDFLSWHIYADDPGVHRSTIEKVARKVREYPGKRPEIMVNE